MARTAAAARTLIGTARTAAATRPAVNLYPLLGRAPAEDAEMRQVRAAVQTWTSWLQRNGVSGFHGEFGWPNLLSNVDSPLWDRVGEWFVRAMDQAGIPFTVWSCQEENSSPAPPLVIYSSNPPASGAPITLRQSQASVVEVAAGPRLGINFDGNSQLYLADGGFDGGNRFYLVPNGSAQPPNPGLYGSAVGSNWSYPNPTSLRLLKALGYDHIRLPIKWERVQPMLLNALDAAEIARIQQVLADCAAAGLTCLIDLHNTGQASVWDGTFYTITQPIVGSPGGQTVTVNSTANMVVNGIMLCGNGGTPEYVKIVSFTPGVSMTGIFLNNRTTNSLAQNQGVLHDVGNADGVVTQAMLVDLWTRLSTALKGRAGLYGYDIMNEPKNIPAAQWETISNAVIAAIRANADTTKLVIEGSHFAFAGDWPTRHPVSWVVDSGANFVYEAHSYPAPFNTVNGNFLNSYATEVANAKLAGF